MPSKTLKMVSMCLNCIKLSALIGTLRSLDTAPKCESEKFFKIKSCICLWNLLLCARKTTCLHIAKCLSSAHVFLKL